MDAQDAAFATLYQSVIGDDIDVCWKYTQILGWNFVDALKFFFEFKWELAVINVGLVIHKSPIVYSECLLILSDIEYIDAMFTLFNAGPFTFSLNTQIVENLMFNFGDIMFNQLEAKRTIGERDYAGFGATVARIISDVFYINPTDEDVWSSVNSMVIESSSSSRKVPSSFYNALTVQSAKPGDNLRKTAEVFNSVVAHQQPRVRDDKARSKRSVVEDVMNVEAFKEGDKEQKALSDMVQELSPQYHRDKRVKEAQIKE